MRIEVSIKAKNDQRSLTEHFEIDELLLSTSSDVLKSWCAKVVADFGEPVEECIVKTKTTV